MPIKLILILAVLLVSLSAPVVLKAQESASPSSEVTTQNLKDRIEKIVNEKKEEIQDAVNNLEQKKRGFICEITRISENSLSVKNSKGSQILSLTDQVEFKKGSKIIKFDQLEVGNWLVVMGIEENQVFSPLRILVSETSLQPTPRKVILGTITKVGSTSVAIKARTGSEEISLNLDKNSLLEDLNEKEISLKQVEENTQALVIMTDNEKSLVRRLRVLTSGL